ncbi:glycosyltransferase family 4 protein [Photobacterium leiognathi]|uniref:glycosyltransferase family 4 protein n=1 Tax=Photobacterium leiognathi TaxID=553611 RepID=UPI0029826DF1|nr:glycosyltransferase family 4 protein [Photobacterium leiognathi]
MLYLMLDSSGFGGIESHVLQLSLLIRDQKIPFKVVFLSNANNHPLYRLLDNNQIDYIVAPGFFRLLLSVNSNDVLHAHGYKSSILARCLKVCRHCKVLTSFHAGEFLIGRLAFYEWLNRYTSFLSVNFAVSDEIRSKIPFRCHVLNNFIHSIPPFLFRSRHKTLQVGFVGRLCHVKGIDRYLQLSNQCPTIQFHVFGDGEEANLLGSYPNVKWHGAVEDMATSWEQLDLLLIPSRAEGLPMAALEAMAHGIPVIGTKVGDLPCLVDSRWLVEPYEWSKLVWYIVCFDSMTNKEWQACSKYSYIQVATHFSGRQRWSTLAKAYGIDDV